VEATFDGVLDACYPNSTLSLKEVRLHPTGAVRARPLTCKRAQEIDALKSEIGEKDHLLQTQVQNMVRAPSTPLASSRLHTQEHSLLA
jgi:hypothetical protein